MYSFDFGPIVLLALALGFGVGVGCDEVVRRQPYAVHVVRR